MTVLDALGPHPLTIDAVDQFTWHERVDLVTPGPKWVLPGGSHVVYRLVLVIDGVGHGLAFVDDGWEVIHAPVPGPAADECRIEAIEAIHDRLEERVDPPEEATLEVVWSSERGFPEEARR